MTWALIELARNPVIQTTLRKELLSFDAEPSYDQLTNMLPYLDAVVHETLRLHTPFTDDLREVRICSYVLYRQLTHTLVIFFLSRRLKTM